MDEIIEELKREQLSINKSTDQFRPIIYFNKELKLGYLRWFGTIFLPSARPSSERAKTNSPPLHWKDAHTCGNRRIEVCIS